MQLWSARLRECLRQADSDFIIKMTKTEFIMRQIIQHFTDDDLYKFTMCCAVIECFPRT